MLWGGYTQSVPLVIYHVSDPNKFKRGAISSCKGSMLLQTNKDKNPALLLLMSSSLVLRQRWSGEWYQM